MSPDIFLHADLPFPKSLPQFQRLFADDAACATYLERIRWEHGFVCPYCGQAGEPFRFAARPGVLRCRKCRKDAALKAGTVMQDTKTPLNVWFWAAYLVASHTAGMSATQFQRQLGLSRYATAHELFTKLRKIPVPVVGEWSILRGLFMETDKRKKPGPRPKPLKARFAKYVDLNGPIPAHRPELGRCHVWTGAMHKCGYGVLTLDAGTELAHRVGFKIAEGRWPDPCALHHCDNRACVRRSHLFEGAKADNTADMVAKKRSTPRVLTLAQQQEVRERKARGETQASIARRFKVSESLISLTLRRVAA